jgi:hypothetical protein
MDWYGARERETAIAACKTQALKNCCQIYRSALAGRKQHLIQLHMLKAIEPNEFFDGGDGIDDDEYSKNHLIAF